MLPEHGIGLEEADHRAMRRAALASVTVAAILIATKLAAWLLSGSVALFGSLLDSSLDLVASLVTLFVIGQALLPPDSNHRFGHGKAEGLGALFQAAVISGSAVFLLMEALARLSAPQAVERAPLGIAVSGLAIVLSLALVAYQRHVARRTGSVAIAADSVHYAGDLLLNTGVIVALVANAWFDATIVDPLFALGIAAFLGWNAWGLARRAIDMLMDREWPEDERERIIGMVLANPAVAGVHELKTRTSGTNAFIQFHIALDPAMTLAKAHTIADEIEGVLGEHYPHAEILIHMDPLGLAEHEQREGYE